MTGESTETKAAFGRRMGVSRQRVSQWASDGLPVTDSGRVRVDAALGWIKGRVPQPGRYPDRGIHRDADSDAATKREPVACDNVSAAYLTGRAAKMIADARRADTHAKRAELELKARRGELIDKARALAHVFSLARTERDAWVNWPARISAMMASELGVDRHNMHVILETHVRNHLAELAEVKPRLD